jgi:outer membrane protein
MPRLACILTSYALAWLSATPSLSAAPADNATVAQTLTLRDALARARAIDPAVAQARVNVERADLAAVRAQLDRVSLSVDGQVQELWSKTNIYGATLYNCQVGTSVMQVDPATCATLGGVSQAAASSSPQSQQGLFNAAARLSVPLFAGFRLSATATRASLLEDAASASLHSTERDLQLAIVRAYWSVRRLGLLVEVQRRTLERLTEAEQVTVARLAAGLAPAIDHNRAVLRRLQGQEALADYAGQLQEASVQLAAALDISSDVRLVDEPSFPQGEPATVATLLAQAESRRPELAAVHLERLAQEQAVRVARSGFYPELDLFGLFQYGNNPYLTGSGARDVSSVGVANPFKSMSGDLTGGLTLSWNVFNMFQTFTSSLDASYQLTIRQEEERRVTRLIEAELRVAHAKVGHLSGRRRALIEAREVAADNLQILRTRYQNGDAMVIEYLDSEVELATAEQLLVGVTVELQIAWTELNLAVGADPLSPWQTAASWPHPARRLLLGLRSHP